MRRIEPYGWIEPDERGLMYEALLDSYRCGWTPSDVSYLFCGIWSPLFVMDAQFDRTIDAFYNAGCWGDFHTAEDWFCRARGSLESYFGQQNSPIVALFDELKKKDELFLLKSLSKSNWNGNEACNYLSACSGELLESSSDASAKLSEEEREKVADYWSVRECLEKVMRAGVTLDCSGEFYGHRATNKFNRSEDGMELRHPVACFRAFAIEVLKPLGFFPRVFLIEDEISAAKPVPAYEVCPVPPRDLERLWASIPPLTAADLDSYTAEAAEAPDDRAGGKADGTALAPDDALIVEGITAGMLRSLLDEKNEGRTFRPRLLAAIRAGLDLDAKKSEIKPGSNFSLTYSESEDECRKRLIIENCRSLGIFNCNDSEAAKRDKSGKKRKVSSLDLNPLSRVLDLRRELGNGRPKKY